MKKDLDADDPLQKELESYKPKEVPKHKKARIKKEMEKFANAEAQKARNKRSYLNLSNPPKNLKELYERLSKWIYITDYNRIDLVLAVIISNQAKNSKPLWLFLVGQSGDAKSEIVSALEDYPDTIILDQITEKTLATGKTYKGKKVPDLGEKLNNSSHIIAIRDLASLKTATTDSKNTIFGQFRELYDGNILKMTGNDAEAVYKNCHVTFIACSTPDIKTEYAIHNQLGTREFSYDTIGSRRDYEAKMKKALEHLGKENEMKKDLQEIIQSFLETHKLNQDIKISNEIQEWMMEKCRELSIFRAVALFERTTGELRGFTSEEVPTRLIQQFALLYKSLKSLDKDYPDKKFKEIVNNIVKSSGDMLRQRLYYFFKNRPNDEYSLKDLYNEFLIGRKTIKKQCETLASMNILSREIKKEYYGATNNLERDVWYYQWKEKQYYNSSFDLNDM